MDPQPSNAGTTNRWLRLVVIVIVAVVPATLFAESTISNGFLSKTELPAGTIVSQSASPDQVVPANTSNITNLLGVVSSSSAIAFTSGTGDVQVVSGGVAMAFISDAKGEIRVGDRITVGELSGVGVKQTESGKIVGVAQLSFNRDSAGAKIQELKDSNGKKHRVAIGQIPVAVNVADYNAASGHSSLVPAPVQVFFNHLLKRDVSTQAIIISTLLLLAGLITAAAILYGATKGGMVSVGRNPLSRGRVFQAFAQAAIVALAIVVLCSGLAYLAALLIM